MTSTERIYIKKGECRLGFQQFVAWNGSFDDLAEDAAFTHERLGSSLEW